MSNYRFVLFGLLAGLSLLVFSGCTGEAALQEYFVEQADNPNFITLDLPLNTFSSDSLTQKGRASLALESQLKSANILLFKSNASNLKELNAEVLRVQSILKHKDFQDLISLKSSKTNGVIKYVAQRGKVKEVIVFGSQSENGFVLIRILGNDIKPTSLLSVLQEMQSASSNSELVKGFGKLL